MRINVHTRPWVATRKEKYRVLFALCAASGLRFGEALGIHVEDVSRDGLTIRIHRKAWKSEQHSFLKTENGKREVDLHPAMAKTLRQYIGERKSGLLFASRRGKPLQQSNVRRRTLHPILAEIGQAKCGAHAFRRFRNTYLRNYTSTPPGLYKFCMGRAGKDMSDLYDKIKCDPAFRKEVAERAGIGFDIPSNSVAVWHENCVLDRMDRKGTEMPDVHLSATV